MLKIGLTGGIGAGKSTVGKVFRHLDIPVFHSDDEAKTAYSNVEIQTTLQDRWGPDIIDQKTLSLEKISRIVFSNEDELHWLESIIHPWVEEKWLHFVEENSKKPYCIKESAILLTTQNNFNGDGIIGVTAEIGIKIQRVMQRSNLTLEQIRARMDRQCSDEQLLSRCQWVVSNNPSDALIPQILRIHEEILLTI